MSSHVVSDIQTQAEGEWLCMSDTSYTTRPRMLYIACEMAQRE